MKIRPTFLFAMLLVATGRPALTVPPARAGKIQITQPSALPKHAYVIKGRPSELVQNREALLSLALQVERDLKADLETFDIQDKSALMSLYSSLYVTGVLKGDHAAARQYLGLYRGLAENPIQKLTTGLLTEPLMEAMEAPGADLHATFRALLSMRLEALPLKDVEGTLQAYRTRQKASSREQIIDGLGAGLDPLVKDGQLTEDFAGTILATAMNLHVLLPVKNDVVACLNRLLAAQRTEPTPGKPAKKALATTQLKAKGAHFGQPLPGETPVLFAPEILNAVSPWVSGIAFSPDGTECFLHVGDATYTGANMYASTCLNGVWAPLVEPAFLSEFDMSAEPVYSKDGQTLTFTGKKGNGRTDFWIVSRTGKGWGAAVAMPAPINHAEANEFRGSITADGTFYFGSERSSPGINQIFKATRNASQAWVVERLGAPINAMSYEGDPCVALDGRFLVFYTGRAGGFGRVDHYVSFSDGEAGWGTPINLGPTFNSPDDEFGACLSPDGQQLFFTRHTAKGDQLFWVATSAIDKLKP